MSVRVALAAAAAATTTTIAIPPAPASAAETVTYTYDAKGRLVQVQRTGSVNNGVATTYAHDKADNRTAKQTTGAP